MAKVIKINTKQGFCCGNDGCVLYDQRGPFLEYAKAVNFNLPPGTYTIKKGTVGALPQPVYYLLPELPPAEKKIELDGMKITEHKSTTVTPKAAIDVANGDYYINPDWEKTLSTPQLCFSQNHEIGHFFYYDQYKCDTWAQYNMLDMGYNPTQIAMASHDTLCGLCKNPGVMEKMLNLEIPLESASRRIQTENKMRDISQAAAMIGNLGGVQMNNYEDA